uniref:Uncharacterized protein n=1 Tax=Panagrolaimus sp. PS1159 TaxID=55785 RepID=A0AC35GFG8_9BILA
MSLFHCKKCEKKFISKRHLGSTLFVFCGFHLYIFDFEKNHVKSVEFVVIVNIMTHLILWNWLAATWIFLVISISTIISFQCLKKGKDAKAPASAATQPAAPESTPAGAQPKSTASKPQSDAVTPATPKPVEAAPKPPAEAPAKPAEAPAKPPAEAEAADGNYEDVAVGASPPPPPA